MIETIESKFVFVEGAEYTWINEPDAILKNNLNRKFTLTKMKNLVDVERYEYRYIDKRPDDQITGGTGIRSFTQLESTCRRILKKPDYYKLEKLVYW